MFLEYYGLTEQPFGVTPDPRFLYLGSKHREALAALDYGTKTQRGFLTLIAKPGMGKTSLLFQYLETLQDKARTAFLCQTQGDSRDLMRYLLADLGHEATGKDLPEMHRMLNQVLLEEAKADRRFVLVIDEAQNLDEKALETVRLLSNFETPWAKLMQIVLAGQLQLAEQLARASMAQLRQRISLFIRIEPFTGEETNAYIDHRLWVAGYQGPQLFTDGARQLIAERSEGTPRVINNICFGAMSLAWALKRPTIDRDLVDYALADLDLGPPNGKADVVSKSQEEPKPTASQILCPTKKVGPLRGWLLGVAAGALRIALSRSVVPNSAAKMRASEPGFEGPRATPVFADSARRASPGDSSDGLAAEGQADGSIPSISERAESQSSVPSKSTSNADRSAFRRYSGRMTAELRRLFRYLARLTREFTDADLNEHQNAPGGVRRG